ncbi:lysine biosynthesis protein LysW [Streptomyces flavidovirens]|uniref:Lysine biosynthesis protein LysW n=1 Tax=Streptomyces flavidovirens TaxID=67298 RepID=A0ABW6RHX9_9ACTN|nr:MULTISPECIES: lysine biosynthesis protein LysW [Streptomyces]MBT2526263.1 lysine biosynthesis protein LysW [Streptomyces sp. ISL-99]
MTTALSVQCPECGGALEVRPDVLAAEIVICQNCSSELEVVATGPVVLALAPEVEEDWGE